MLTYGLTHPGLRPREELRTACRSADVALTVATGDHRFYANALLTIGAVLPADRADEPGRSAPNSGRL